MFKRRSTQSTVSPLPPPASTRASTSGSMTPVNGSNSGLPLPSPGGPGMGFGGSGPSSKAYYTGGADSERIASTDTAKEKRRSGFFGLGGRKEKEKDREVHQTFQSQPRPRPVSFAAGHDGQYQQQPPYPMRQYNSYDKSNGQSNGQTNGPMNGARVVSAPRGAPSDLAPVPPFPRSQSMGIAQRGSPGSGAGFTGSGGGPSSMDSTPRGSMSVPRTPDAPSSPASTTGGGGWTVSPRASVQGVDGRQEWASAFEPVVELITHQPHKTYVASPPELEMILARTSAGHQPKQGQPGSPSNDWDAVWLQLSGTSLSMWSMKETRAAAAKGEKVPPTYFNITDSSLELLNPLPPPPHRPQSHAHNHVFSLNTAGSNRLLFSSPSERDLIRWSTGLRLAAWERSRLEEMYTGHLIRSGGREPPHPLVRGRLEGWVRVRAMGATDWTRLWLVLSEPNSELPKEDEKKARRRSLFSMGEHKNEPVQEPNTGVPMASFYHEPRTAKNKTSSLPVLAMTNITQVYAVFPEHLEVMNQSNMMKVVGRIGGEMVTIEGGLRDSGWALIMPEALEPTPTPPPSPLATMMRWLTAFHDAYKLYGRPGKYNFDERDPQSLFFGYPRGPLRGDLFLNVDEAVRANYRLNTPAIRARFTDLVLRRIRGVKTVHEEEEIGHDESRSEPTFRLPPLSFNDKPQVLQQQDIARSLTPITEQTDASRNNSTRTQSSNQGHILPTGKQGSRDTSKHYGELEPILDRSENLAQDSLDETSQENDANERLPTPTPGTPSSSTTHTEPTIWSQETGKTPIQSVPNTPSYAHDPTPPVHALAITPSLTPALSQDSVATATQSSISKAPPTPIPVPQTKPEVIIAPTPRRVSSSSEPLHVGLRDEPAALYLMNMVEDPLPITKPQSVPALVANKSVPQLSVSPSPVITPLGPILNDKPSRPTIVTSLEAPSSSRPELARRPSGARAPRSHTISSAGSRTIDPIDESAIASTAEPQRLSSAGTHSDFGEEAAAYVAYAEQYSPVANKIELAPAPAVVPPQTSEPEVRSSSFALSKAAAERRARAERTAAEQQRAMTMPGGGRRVSKTPATRGNWSGSEDEDDEEDSPKAKRSAPESVVVQRSASRALPPVPVPRPTTMTDYTNGDRDLAPPLHSLSIIDRPRSQSPAPHRQLPLPLPLQQQHHQQQPGQPLPQPPAARQSVWNANFSVEHGMGERSGKFVDLDEPSAQLTKAFAPHGLLQAGMQDKEDRSAKRQEEVARETGSSLISVPAKPPPPQTGLLGAVAAHERDRKNPGGIGATLTDRERERRLAEERQRKIDELQRQQMEHMSQYGAGGLSPGVAGMYGAANPYQQYPYGMPPMPYPPFQGSGQYPQYQMSPQQHAMMAAQMAYSQTIMAMSAAGSQMGEHEGGVPGRPASPAGSNAASQFATPYPPYGYMPPPPQSMYGFPGYLAPPPPNSAWGGAPSPQQGLASASPYPRMSVYEGMPTTLPSPGMPAGLPQASYADSDREGREDDRRAS